MKGTTGFTNLRKPAKEPPCLLLTERVVLLLLLFVFAVTGILPFLLNNILQTNMSNAVTGIKAKRIKTKTFESFVMPSVNSGEGIRIENACLDEI